VNDWARANEGGDVFPSAGTIRCAIEDLLRIVSQLRVAYPKKSFTLDGRLVGDLGEMLAECNYQINVFPGCRPRHDAQTTDGTGRLVQIKVTMKGSLTFPADHVPDYYLGLLIMPDGSLKEIFKWSRGCGRTGHSYQAAPEDQPALDRATSPPVSRRHCARRSAHPSPALTALPFADGWGVGSAWVGLKDLLQWRRFARAHCTRYAMVHG